METAKMWFWIVLDVAIGLVAVNLVFFVMPMLGQLKDSFAPARTITISAQGLTTATPDMAEISFSVVTQGKDPQALSDNNNQKMTAVMQFVSSQNIASSDIATTGYNLMPNYQWDKNTQRNYITGYTLTQTVQVKVRDLSKVASVLGGLAPLGVNQIGSVNYTFQDPNKFIALARADALSKAQKQVNEMVSETGASVGKIMNISESSYIPYPRASYDYATGMGGAATVSIAPPIQPGTQDVTDTVNVTYEIY